MWEVLQCLPWIISSLNVGSSKCQRFYQVTMNCGFNHSFVMHIRDSNIRQNVSSNWIQHWMECGRDLCSDKLWASPSVGTDSCLLFTCTALRRHSLHTYFQHQQQVTSCRESLIYCLNHKYLSLYDWLLGKVIKTKPVMRTVYFYLCSAYYFPSICFLHHCQGF